MYMCIYMYTYMQENKMHIYKSPNISQNIFIYIPFITECFNYMYAAKEVIHRYSHLNFLLQVRFNVPPPNPIC